MRQTRNNLNKFISIGILFMISLTSLGIGADKSTENKKIHDNIVIENIDVGKMTKKEALKKLNETYEIKNFKIFYNDKTWDISPQNIDIDYHIEESVNKAFNYTRSDNTWENIKRRTGLRFNKPYTIKLKATYSEIKLSEELSKISNEINIDAQDATLKVEPNGEIRRTKSKIGKQVDLSRLKEEIYTMLNNKKIKDVNLELIDLKPRISTEEVESIDTILAQFSTSFNDSTSRGSNIHVAGESTSDILLMPGDMFSYNRATGARTWNNGYKSAPIIVGGRVVNGEGGGVCQVSTTIYNAALLSGLKIDEVHNHTIPSRYAPRGRDASVSYGYTDLKFTNPFNHPIYIKNIVGNGAITTKIYGCKRDCQKVIIKMKEEFSKDKITVQTYRLYLDEENNIINKELISTSKYKLK